MPNRRAAATLGKSQKRVLRRVSRRALSLSFLGHILATTVDAQLSHDYAQHMSGEYQPEAAPSEAHRSSRHTEIAPLSDETFTSTSTRHLITTEASAKDELPITDAQAVTASSQEKLTSHQSADKAEFSTTGNNASLPCSADSPSRPPVVALSQSPEHGERLKKHAELSALSPHSLPKPKETRSVSVKATNMIPDPAVSLSTSRPTMLPPPRPSTAASSFINPTPTLTPGSTWGPSAASAAAARAEAAEPGRIGDLKRFTLWETKTRFYLVAYNTSQTRFRILKVDRTPPIASDTFVPPEDTPASKSEAASAPRVPNPIDTTSRVTSAKSKDTRIPPQPRVKHAPPNRNDEANNLSARGQLYLSVDDPQIPLLNRQLLDAKQNESVNRESAATSGPAQGLKASTSGNRGSLAVPASGVPGAASNRNSTVDVSAPAVGSTPEKAAPTKAERANPVVSNKSPDAEWELSVTSDRVVYSRTQVAELLEMIREGNRATGGLREIGRFFGIVGFIRFTGTYYMVLISRRSVVALIGGHYIHHCDETAIVPVCHPSVLASLPGRTKLLEQEEARLLHLFKQVDLSKNFYFSYTYDLTKTLQDNLTSSPEEPAATNHSSNQPLSAWGYNEKFIWNHNLLLPAFGASERQQPGEDARNEWVLPLIYGFVDQAKLSVLNRTVYVTLIARRSRHFAGARFLKRGINERGHVANDVETEQIVSDALTTAFFAPGRRRKRTPGSPDQDRNSHPRSSPEIVKASGLREKPSFGLGKTSLDDYLGHRFAHNDDDEDEENLPYEASPRYTSYVMMRGSIPVYWTQDSTNMSPRPPIEISLVDPYYSAAALHFDDLFHRYGTPVIVLNLIKSKEKQEREVKLLRAFGECVDYLNQFLPSSKKIKYIAWDMSRASKAHDQDVIGVLEDIAEETVETTRFFHSGPEPSSFGLAAKARSASLSSREAGHSELGPEPLSSSGRRENILLQEGIARVNCVDCLDRTNAAQFVIGKAAFGHQLHALGLLDNPSLPFDSDAVNMLTEMYHDQGDTIAMQYGGSALAHTTDTYRKINQWTSHSRDVLETMKRYYANSFADADKQAAINLFLGVDPSAPDFSPHVFPENVQAESSDAHAPTTSVPFRPHYQHWFNPVHLEPAATVDMRQQRLTEVVNADAGFWAEYYRPSLFTDLHRHHAFKMTAVHQSSSGPSTISQHASAGYFLPSSSSTGSLHANSPQISSVSRHGRSGSISSLSAWKGRTSDTLVEYPSPFKPHSTGGRSQAVTAGTSDVLSLGRTRSASIDATLQQDRTNGHRTLNDTHHSTSSPISTSAGSLPPSQAILGGVRRWMSINQPNALSTDIGAGTGRRSASKRYADDGSVTGPNAGRQNYDGMEERKTDPSSGLDGQGGNSIGTFDPRTFNFAGRWQTLNAAVPVAAGANVAIDVALEKATNPQVSVEEESEYASYTTQFMDKPEHNTRRRASFTSPGGTEKPAPGSAPRLMAADHHMIDDKDIEIYEEGVGLSVDGTLRTSAVDPGLVAYVNSISNNFLAPSSLSASTSTSLDQSFAAVTPSTNGIAGTSNITLPAGLSTALEAKVRAYGSWLSMGQSKLASF